MNTIDKALAARQQPVAWKTLSNALRSRTYAHAYLFQGQIGTAKREMALLFAQSVFCPHSKEGIACGECEVCRRVAALEYADLSYIDGSETSIKKADVLRLQEQFSRTSLEISPYRIYIMDHAENATPDALNSLLKFLEEPQPGIIAILISDHPELLLPTIVSRCQCIPFHPLNQRECLRMGMEAGECDMSISVLQRIAHRYGITTEELMFGAEAKMNAYFLTRKGAGVSVERVKAYKYELLASGFKGRIADPFIVTIEPKPEGTPLYFNSHDGQEFQMVIEGRLLVNIDGKELTLEPGDSLYFDSSIPHGLKALDGKHVKFLTLVIQ